VGILIFPLHLREHSLPLSLPLGPLGFDFDRTLNPHCVMVEAAPQPILGPLDDPAMHRVAVYAAEYLGSLRFAPDVEIVVTRLPEAMSHTPRPGWGTLCFFFSIEVILRFGW
jgi:hypothetical protein